MHSFTRRKPGMGVYTITNVVDGNVYVGCTGNFSARWSRHKVELRKGTHHNKPMQAAWNEHGEAAFVFAVALATADVSLMVQHEQAMIDGLLATHPAGLYNTNKHATRTTKGQKRAHCCRGHELSDDNIYVSKDGHRHCRTCKRDAYARRSKQPERIAQTKRYAQARRDQGKHRAYIARDPEKWRAYHRDYKRRQTGIPLDRPVRWHPKGEHSGHAYKLTDAQVRAIRQRVAAGERQVALASEYGVSRGLVNKIVSGERRPDA